MSYRVLSTDLKRIASEAVVASAGESRAFSAFAEAMAWAMRPRRGNVAVVVIEESRNPPLVFQSPEEAARSVA